MKKYIALLLLISSVAWGGELNDQLLMLNQAKHDIKVAAEGKGVTIGNANLEDYAGIISQIPYASGGLYLDNIYMQHNTARGTIVTMEAGADKEVVLDDQPDVASNLGVQGMAFSADGRKLVVKGRGTGIGMFSYTYDGANGGWVKDPAPDTMAPAGSYFLALSRDGSIAIVPGAGANALSVYQWDAVDGRYEALPSTDVSPSTGYGATIMDDLSRVVVTDANSDVATRVYTLTWSEVDGTYKASTPVDTQPTGRAYGCAMSADGNYLAVAHAGAGKVATYKWHSGNGRYELTAAHNATITTTVTGCSLSANGAILAVGYFTTAPYVKTFSWNAGNNRYEEQGAVSYTGFTAPAGSAYTVSLSDDASILTAGYNASTTAGIPNFVVFKWDSTDNRYEAVATYKQDSDASPVGVAISGNGKWAASSHSDNSYPVHLYDFDVHTAKIHFNPTDGLGVDILGLGYTLKDALKDEIVPVQTIWWREALDE